MTSTPPIVIDPVGENYQVKWDTGGLGLLTSVDYRIQVFVDSVLLGFADVDVVLDNKGLKGVPTGFVGLVRNKSLQIKFRIETGIVGQVTVSPSTATILAGETQQFTATLTDLHGNPLSGPPITWASDNTGIATVDGNGLATAESEGTTTITALSQNISGTATLTIAEFSSISAGGSHSCGVTPSGTAFCWGLNAHGQLGDGTNTDSNGPVQVVGNSVFVTVNAGGSHTCGLTTSGTAYCWGRNQAGQLGDGTNFDSNSPVAVVTGPPLVSLTTGNFHTCGVATTGDGYCWGANSYGQLGTGMNNDSNVPVPVSGSLAFDFISAGGSDGHSCGKTATGELYCWGNNAYGQLGDGTITDSNVPVAVFGSQSFVSVNSSGHSHSCGLTGSGAIYCWGFNGYNQLGDGTNIRSSVPVEVVGGHTFASVNTGGHHSCGVTTAGAVYCWGHNAYGDLGRGTNTNGEGMPLEVSGSHTFASVAAGSLHSCGVDTAGSVYCWGYNASGQLGSGTNTDSNVPVAVGLP
ncbi:MAG TPA: Ig-like domain-containing protein [Gemmatimonadota bacterium]|nr:Ig-like domain-containing protein [Gemmatimonadota bacterium]